MLSLDAGWKGFLDMKLLYPLPMVALVCGQFYNIQKSSEEDDWKEILANSIGKKETERDTGCVHVNIDWSDIFQRATETMACQNGQCFQMILSSNSSSSRKISRTFQVKSEKKQNSISKYQFGEEPGWKH